MGNPALCTLSIRQLICKESSIKTGGTFSSLIDTTPVLLSNGAGLQDFSHELKLNKNEYVSTAEIYGIIMLNDKYFFQGTGIVFVIYRRSTTNTNCILNFS